MRIRSYNVGLTMIVIYLSIVIMLMIGWIMNIVAIAHLTAFSGMAVLRVIGVFLAPLGGVLGWF